FTRPSALRVFAPRAVVLGAIWLVSTGTIINTGGARGEKESRKPYHLPGTGIRRIGSRTGVYGHTHEAESVAHDVAVGSIRHVCLVRCGYVVRIEIDARRQGILGGIILRAPIHRDETARW